MDLSNIEFNQMLANSLGCEIYCYDYSGYGLSSGKPSEANIYEDVRTVYQHILETRSNIKV